MKTHSLINFKNAFVFISNFKRSFFRDFGRMCAPRFLIACEQEMYRVNKQKITSLTDKQMNTTAASNERIAKNPTRYFLIFCGWFA